MQERIGDLGLFSLVFIFTIGNTGLYALGLEKAGQDAWIALLVAMFASYGLLWVYIKLQSYFPEDNLAAIVIKLLGKVVGLPLIILYSLYFLYIVLLNITLYIEFVRLFLIPGTPVLVLYILIMILTVYIILAGVEVITRVAIIAAGSFILFITLIYPTVFLSGVVDLTNLQPVLGRGLRPVIDGALPDLMIFPYADMVVFLTIWRYVKNKRSIFKASILGMTVAGVIISFALVVSVATLGVDLATKATYANMRVSDIIDVGIFNNMDIVVVAFLLLSGFYKVVPFLYGATSLLEESLNRKNKVGILLTLTILLGIFIYFPFKGPLFYEWVDFLPVEITEIIKYIHVSFQMIIPALLLLIFWVKRDLMG